MRHFSTTILFLRLLQLAANKLVQALRDHSAYQLRIIGYANSRGTVEYNQAPLERRTEAVKRYFIDWRVDPSPSPKAGAKPSRPLPTPCWSACRTIAGSSFSTNLCLPPRSYPNGCLSHKKSIPLSWLGAFL